MRAVISPGPTSVPRRSPIRQPLTPGEQEQAQAGDRRHDSRLCSPTSVISVCVGAVRGTSLTSGHWTVVEVMADKTCRQRQHSDGDTDNPDGPGHGP